TCRAPCTWDDAILLVSLPARYARGQGLPPAQEVRFPALRSQPVNQTVTLPVDGEPVRYPFDRYEFTLGVLVRHENPDGADVCASPQATGTEGQQLSASLRMAAPRMTISEPAMVAREELDPAAPTLPYYLTVRMTFSRPLYLKVLTVLLVLLVTAAAA